MVNKKINIFTIIIIMLAIVASMEIFMIIRNVFLIKGSNLKLENEIIRLKNENIDLYKKNKLLNNKISDYQNPEMSLVDTPEGWKLFRYLDKGFEIAFPKEGKVDISGGHSPAAHPEIIERLSVFDKNPKIKADINIIDAGRYDDIKTYINKEYNYRVYFKRGEKLLNTSVDIYKLSGDKYYFVFFKGRKYIIDIGSPFEEYLIKIASTFKFI